MTQEGQNAEIQARAEAARIEAVEGARVAAERARTEVYAGLPGPVLHALTLRELAANLPEIEHLTLAPELLTPLLSRLIVAASEG